MEVLIKKFNVPRGTAVGMGQRQQAEAGRQRQEAEAGRQRQAGIGQEGA